MSKIPVLIIGAGPSGLMMACELARHGIPFRIIDKKPERTATSNAVWLQTRTLEILDDIGIADKFLRIGRVCKAIALFANNKPLTKISFNYLDSLYRYVLMLPQADTERLLNAHLEELNFFVERPLELVEIKLMGNTVDTVVLDGNGQTQVITCDWLIACDGVNSTVRNSCKINFPGNDMKEQFMVADTQMSSFTPSDEVCVFLDKGTIFAAFPFGESKYRIGANLALDYPRKFFTEKEVKELIAERASSEFTAESVSWISPFWIHSKAADELRRGAIFLVGDSAHVHSPALGQGMNSGLQDAYNLAWKLALVIQGKAKNSLLETYQSERHRLIREIIDRSSYFTKMAMYRNRFYIRLRNFSLRLMHSMSYFSNKVSMRITQLSLRYESSPIIDYEFKPTSDVTMQGKRAPDVVIESTRRLHQYFQNTKHNVLLFTGKSPSADDLNNLKNIQQSLLMLFSDTVNSYLVTQDPAVNKSPVIFDKGALIHKKYRVKKPSIFVIRPDGIIAYYSPKPNEYAVKDFFDRYMHS